MRMQNAAKGVCGMISNNHLGPDYFKSEKFPFPHNRGIRSVDILISLQIKPRCSLSDLSGGRKRDLEKCDANPNFDMTLFQKYLSVPTDSCTCGRVNGKQGGVMEDKCYIWRIDSNVDL